MSKTHNYFFGGGRISDEKWNQAFGRNDTVSVLGEKRNPCLIAQLAERITVNDKVSGSTPDKAANTDK